MAACAAWISFTKHQGIERVYDVPTRSKRDV